MTKRTLSVLLALCMLVGLLPFGAFAAQGAFSDVPADAWYAADVAYAAEQGLMNGVGGGRFDPDGTTTRAMLVTILHRLEGLPAAEKSAFTDVPAGEWYTAAVDWAAAHKIVEGMDAATFAPASPVTREQFAVILYRYANFKGMDTAQKAELSAFSDAASVSAWAADAMAWANAAGLVNGVSITELQPQGSATRAQAAAILARFDRIVKAGETKPGTVTLSVDKTDATVTEPRQTFTGAYTVENDQIDRIDWVQHADAEAYEGVTGTAMIDQTKGTWEAADILLAPGANTITFTAYTKNGAKAEQTVEITYDSGELADTRLRDVSFFRNEDGSVSQLGYLNNRFLVVLDCTYSAEEKAAVIEAICKAVNGTVIGENHDLELYQIGVEPADDVTLSGYCEIAKAINNEIVLSANLSIYYPSPELPENPNVNAAEEAQAMSVPDLEAADYPNDTWYSSGAWVRGDGTNLYRERTWWTEIIHARGAWAYNDYFHTISIGLVDSGVANLNGSGNSTQKKHEDIVVASTVNSSSGYYPGHHGTHVAGIMAATPNNGKGITGIVWNKNLYNYDAYLGQNGTSSDNLANGVAQLVRQGCRVVNNSNGMGYDDYSALNASGQLTAREDESTCNSYLQNLIRNYPKFIVTQAAGNGYNNKCDDDNNSSTAERYKGHDAYYNGTFTSVTNAAYKEHIIVVGAVSEYDPTLDVQTEDGYSIYTTTGDYMAEWSNWGNRVDIAAPGDEVYSTVYYDKDYFSSTSEYNSSEVKDTCGYAFMSGTSMAAPVAAGVTALVWSVNDDFTAAEVKSIITSTSQKQVNRHPNNVSGMTLSRYVDPRAAYPMVDAEAAVKEALRRTYGDGTLDVSFVNSANNQPVNNVSYEIRLGSPTGTVVASGTASGSASITLPRAQGTDYHQAQYYLVATGNFTDYSSTAFTIDVGGTTSLTAALNVPEAPQAQSYRIVLTWNAEPADLDAHLFGAGGHVYYKHHSIDHARMDLDDTQSFGPETITVDDVSALGGFTYAVHNFTDRAQFSDAAGLAGSGATVRVYSGSTLLKTYTVPTNMLGTVWNVFSVSDDGTIIDGGAFAYSGNGEAIPGLFTDNAAPQSAAWQTVAPKKQ